MKQDVPPCCPCNCFAQLDLPYYIWFGYATLGATLELVADAVINPMSLRLLRLVVPFLAITSTACAIVKLCIMCGRCCQHLAPQSAGSALQAPGEQHLTVVGQPVTVGGEKIAD
eukprot:CAMPEP_0117535056 /NCGR_PEP_ID=MMETSP0784-20121206/40737_1 /TAXON_ID=39447 /ORGANISM="" /LENGTH=113 /DNA_ID=CAMNT_0005331569 /DNA_START=290 /DNA_END=631 /DNA_ORIENTATION=-